MNIRTICISGLIVLALAGLAGAFLGQCSEGYALAGTVAAGLIGYLKSDD